MGGRGSEVEVGVAKHSAACAARSCAISSRLVSVRARLRARARV